MSLEQGSTLFNLRVIAYIQKHVQNLHTFWCYITSIYQVILFITFEKKEMIPHGNYDHSHDGKYLNVNHDHNGLDNDNDD